MGKKLGIFAKIGRSGCHYFCPPGGKSHNLIRAVISPTSDDIQLEKMYYYNKETGLTLQAMFTQY